MTFYLIIYVLYIIVEDIYGGATKKKFLSLQNFSLPSLYKNSHTTTLTLELAGDPAPRRFPAGLRRVHLCFFLRFSLPFSVFFPDSFFFVVDFPRRLPVSGLLWAAVFVPPSSLRPLLRLGVFFSQLFSPVCGSGVRSLFCFVAV